MSNPRIYLDHAAATPINAEAARILLENFGLAANASSVHHSGRRARQVLEHAREQLAELLRCHPTEVIFTSGGTEANNIVLKGLWWKQQRKGRPRVLVGATEHHAIFDVATWLANYHEAMITMVPANSAGIITPEALQEAIGPDSTDIAGVSVMWLNNEIGTIADIAALAKIAQEHDVVFHSDAIAAAGHIPLSFVDSGVDALSISGHKFGAPGGIGAAIISRDAQLEPLIHGGGQERNLRSGSYNYPAAAAMAAALAQGLADHSKKYQQMWFLRDYFLAALRKVTPDFQVNGPAGDSYDAGADQQFPGIVNISFSQCDAESLFMLLDKQGIDCSTGAACSAGVASTSHVLQAIGRLDPATGVRFSFDSTLKVSELDRVISTLAQIVPQAQRAWSATIH